MTLSADRSASPAEPSGATGVPHPTRNLTLVAAAIVVVGFVFRYVTTARSFFAQDDYIYISVARQTGLSWDWLSSEWFQHVAPLHRLAFSAINPTLTSWHVTLLLEVVVVVVAVAVWWALLLRLFGPTRWLLVGLTWFVFTPGLVPVLIWPSAGVQMAPDLLCSVTAVYATVRYAEDGRRRWVVLAGAAMALGLLFYLRPLLIPVYALIVRVLATDSSVRPADVLRTLWRERPLWLTLGAIAVAYVGIYLAFVYPGSAGGSITPAAVADVLRILWLRTLAFTAVGLDIPEFELSTAQHVVQVLVVGAVVTAVLWSLLRAPHRATAWRGWAIVVLVPLAVLAVVGAGRLGVFGPRIGFDVRYMTNAFWLLPIGVLVAYRGVRRPGTIAPAATGPTTAGPTGPTSGLRGRSAVVPVAVLATVAFAVVAGVTSWRQTDDWLGTQARPWMLNARNSLIELQAAHAPGRVVRLSDGTVPLVAVDAGFIPANSLEWTVPDLAPGVVVVPAGQGDFHLDPDGIVRPGP